jgi:hypothetical protein
MNMKVYRRVPTTRRGNIVVLTVILMLGMVGLLAFALDIGYIYTARTQLQRSADAAALAATSRLLEDQIATLGEVTDEVAATNARAEAEVFAALNPICLQSPDLSEDDVVVGTYVVDESGEGSVQEDPDLEYNTVSVRVQRTSAQNGEVQLFFARLMGRETLGLQCDATAAFWSGFRGFQLPSNGDNLGIMPLTIDRDTWEDGILNGGGADNYSYNTDTGAVTAGSDGIPEVNLYPQGTGSPGNRGTVDIGSSGNSTADLVRQLLYGVNAADLEYHGGKLELDANGELELNGDTGISAGIKDALASIKGKPRVIPIFDSVTGNGNNANYTITGFAGVRIMNVKLTGAMSSKNVMIQPAAVQLRGGIRAEEGSTYTRYIYSPVVLVK